MTMETDDTKLTNILNHQREHWGNFVSELIDGRKRSHWCWYFLFNVPGLGRSEQSRYFAVELNEFARYMENPEYSGNICTVVFLIDQAYRRSPHMDLTKILGEVDALKFRSFMSLLWVYFLTYEHPSFIHCQRVTEIFKHAFDVYGKCDFTLDYLNDIVVNG